MFVVRFVVVARSRWLQLPKLKILSENRLLCLISFLYLCNAVLAQNLLSMVV